MNNIKTYRINRFAEVEGNAASGWVVINLVTGLAQETMYTNFIDARSAANHLSLHYAAIEMGG